MPEITQTAFGRTGHQSTRVIFGAAAFFTIRPDKAEQILELLLRCGVNPIEAAADYGHAELRIGAWMPIPRPILSGQQDQPASCRERSSSPGG